jgi:hypothetical protein
MTLDDIKARCEEVGNCWIWQGAVSATGYPITKASGVRSGCLLVRRLAVELDGRPAKPRQPVLASCGDKLCCNPACLKPSNASAVGKAAAKAGAWKTLARRAKIAKAQREKVGKLTQEIVTEVKTSHESTRVIAKRLGINRRRVVDIRNGRAWIDYSNPFAQLGAR